MPDEKTMLAAYCWLHGQVVVHQHFLDNEQTSCAKNVLLVSGHVKHLSPYIGSISM